MKKSFCIVLIVALLCTMTLPCFAFPNLTMVGKDFPQLKESDVAMASSVFLDTFRLMVGESCQLIPDNTMNCKWESSNERVATVSPNGVVQGLRNGETMITLTDADLSQITISVRFIIGTGVENVELFSSKADLSGKKIKGYVGPGFSIIAFEAGPLYSGSTDEDIQEVINYGATFSPSLYGEYDFPSYGTCQMIEGTVKGFYSWMMKDTNRTNLWRKIFGYTEIICTADSEFTYRWKNASSYLTEEEYVLFGSYQIEYMYRQSGLSDPESSTYKMIVETGIDPNRSRVLQEFFFACTNQGAFSTAFKAAHVNGDMTDEEIITAICKVYGTKIIWSAGLTTGMRNKWYGNGNGIIIRYYLALAKAQLPKFSFDDITNNAFVEATNPNNQNTSQKITFDIVIGTKPINPENNP